MHPHCPIRCLGGHWQSSRSWGKFFGAVRHRPGAIVPFLWKEHRKMPHLMRAGNWHSFCYFPAQQPEIFAGVDRDHGTEFLA